MSADNSTGIFIERARALHGSKYDYQRVIYNGVKNKVCINCPEHGDFFQTPDNHLNNKNGCPLCAVKKRSEEKTFSQEEFLQRAYATHGQRYDYRKTNYKKLFEEVVIVCSDHGEFFQTPANHLHNHQGCPKCGDLRTRKARRLTTRGFIHRSVSVHGNKYDYSKVECRSSEKKVCIICPDHGEFYQDPSSHLAGRGCLRCGRVATADKTKITTEEFIGKALRVHGKFYDYSKVNYIGAKTCISIICPIHGMFLQPPTKHLCGHKCPYCRGSKGERAIKRWLDKNNIGYKYQYMCPDLRGVRRPLVFDFCTQGIKVLIEYDGEQHSNPVRFNGISEGQSIENFKKTQYYDVLKDQYCIKKGIPLLRISHKEFNDIPSILYEKLLGMHSYSYKIKYLVNELNNPEVAEKNEQSLAMAEEDWKIISHSPMATGL